MSTFYYFDNNATTRPTPEVIQAMGEMLDGVYGNPSSIHAFANQAERVVEQARIAVASLLKARPAEVIFTSGATESINSAFYSVFDGGCGGHIVSTAVEHPAVLRCIERWAADGVKVTLLPVDAEGRLEAKAVEEAITEETRLVAVMAANNETGVVFPTTAISEICTSRSIPLLVDASQAIGKVPFDVRTTRADYVALSAHKFHGPKGVGALFVRRGSRYRPLIIGGGQEKGRRSGTINVPGVVGMGVAAVQVSNQDVSAMARIAGLRDSFERRVLELLPDARINGLTAPRLPSTTNISFRHASGEAILQLLDELGIAASSSSACSSNEQEPSHVLRAMRVPESHIHGSVRIGLSRYTQQEEIDHLLSHLPQVIEHARAASPFLEDELPVDYVESHSSGRTHCE